MALHYFDMPALFVTDWPLHGLCFLFEMAWRIETSQFSKL